MSTKKNCHTLGDTKKTKVKNHTFNHIQYQNIDK